MMKNSFLEFCSTRYSSKVKRKYDKIGILFNITCCIQKPEGTEWEIYSKFVNTLHIFSYKSSDNSISWLTWVSNGK